MFLISSIFLSNNRVNANNLYVKFCGLLLKLHLQMLRCKRLGLQAKSLQKIKGKWLEFLLITVQFKVNFLKYYIRVLLSHELVTSKNQKKKNQEAGIRTKRIINETPCKLSLQDIIFWFAIDILIEEHMVCNSNKICWMSHGSLLWLPLFFWS